MDYPSPYLTFLFDSANAREERAVKVKLSLQATALEVDLAALAGGGASDYPSWLTFILPQTVIDEDDPIEVNVPNPRRAPPVPPNVNEQGVGPAHSAEATLSFDQTRQYAYRYDYTRPASDWDLLYSAIRFNTDKPADTPAKVQGDQMDLFQALASFERCWDPLRQDLLSADLNHRRSALREFVRIVGAVRDAWGPWRETWTHPDADSPPDSAECLFAISEREPSDPATQPRRITIRRCGQNAKAPGPSIEIAGWSKVDPVPATPDSEDPVVQFELKPDAEKGTPNQPLIRTVVVAGLDLLAMENAVAVVTVTRNETLFDDRPCTEGAARRTNPKFVYRTPMVRFAQPATPKLEYAQPIDIAKLSGAEDSRDAPRKTVEAHLTHLFRRLLEAARKKPPTRRLQLTCVYQYDVANDSSLTITLPIAMAPPLELSVDDPSSLVRSLSKAIRGWFREREPTASNGRFVFDVSIYGTLGEVKLPIYRLRSLQLALAEIDPNDLRRVE